MEKHFNIEGLENSYGMVSGEEIGGKYYLKLDDYSGYKQVEISKASFDALHRQFGEQVSNTYSYTVDFFKGISTFGQTLEFFKTVSIKSTKELSDDEIKEQAYKLVGNYPRSHSIKTYRLQ